MTQTRSRPEASSQTSFRADIEGLRALAVVLVLVGHAGSQFLPGGFVGVDVFFVISGFLITGLLVDELDRTGRISLAGFYARRAKRLLPAAGLVLLATLLLTYLFLPKVRFSNTAWDVVSSALYVMNWRLAQQSVDYMFVDQAPSVLQHYWSLSVEEQFYLIWPLLLLGLTVLGGRKRLRRDVLMVGFAVVALPSFAWSIHLTSADPAPAYFVTTTRMWELALGGAVAIVGARLHRTPRGLAPVLAWSGLAGVVASAFVLDSTSAFPGYAALLPTAGTAVVIAFAAAAGRAGPAGLLSLPPMRVIGGLSYSLYLWHWPLLMVADYRFGELTPSARLAVVALSAVPAGLTYHFVENPIRRSPALAWYPMRALRLGALCTGTAVIAGLLFQLTVWPPARAPLSAPAVPSLGGSSASASANAPAGPPGAAVLSKSPRGDLAGRPVDRVDSITPDPLVAAKDVPATNRTNCHIQQNSSEPVTCVYGVKDASYTVLLAGDSHAEQWLPALEEVAVKRNWRVVAHIKSACPFLAMEVALDGRPYTSCTEWNRRIRAQLRADPPDLLLVGSSFYLTLRDGELVTQGAQEILATGLRDSWREMTTIGVPVVVLRDPPYHRRDPVECVSANPNRLTRCAPQRDEVLAAGGGIAQERAAKRQPGVHLINLNDAICPTDRCAPVIGGVLVYRDTNHLTATYARTLAPRLDSALATVQSGGI
ncbi:acyltransferase family protein [Micromonospora sp. NPDC007271]|uniref:acyltransferase family protein n=1 Tax=Micromonospora sp. NPDC007271 TaxID=3154587 RepID=UPI0033E498D0